MLQTAALSIQHGLKYRSPLEIDSFDFDTKLQDKRATFVTLEIDEELRGCIGTLTANQPLIEDIANNAFSSAFKDPRFSALTKAEFDKLSIHISVLTPPEPFPVANEPALIANLVSGEDGLILKDGNYHATFLPSVWETLPFPRDFLRQLKLKAGLPADYWSETIQFERYHTVSFGKLVKDISLEYSVS